jgi:hypothetical protein
MQRSVDLAAARTPLTTAETTWRGDWRSPLRPGKRPPHLTGAATSRSARTPSRSCPLGTRA